MDTQNNESKQQPKNPGLMVAHEKMNWKVGEDIIYFTGGEEQQPVAFIKLEKYEERDGKKKPVFSARDLDGNVLSENSSNLYDLKRDIKEKEIALTQAMREKEAQQIDTPAKVETPTQQPVAPSTTAPEITAKTSDQEKGNALKNVRRRKTDKDKDKNAEQSLSH